MMDRAVGHVNVNAITAIEIGCKTTAEEVEVATIEDRTVLGGTLVEVVDSTTTAVEAVITVEKIEGTTTGTIDKGDRVATIARSPPFDIAVDAIAIVIVRTLEARHPQAEVDQQPLHVAVKKIAKIADTAVNPDLDLHRRPRNKTNNPDRKAPNPSNGNPRKRKRPAFKRKRCSNEPKRCSS